MATLGGLAAAVAGVGAAAGKIQRWNEEKSRNQVRLGDRTAERKEKERDNRVLSVSQLLLFPPCMGSILEVDKGSRNCCCTEIYIHIFKKRLFTRRFLEWWQLACFALTMGTALLSPSLLVYFCVFRNAISILHCDIVDHH